MSKLPIIYVEQARPSFLPYGSISAPCGIWDCLQANKAYDERTHEGIPREAEIPHLDRKA